MNEENDVIIDTSNDTVEETEINLDETSEDVDVEALKEQNKKLFARAKRAEGFTQDSNGNWVKREKQQINNKVETRPYNILEDEVANLIFDGYTRDEIRFIQANGGKKALEDKNSFVSVAVNAKREQRKTEEAVTQTSDKGYVSQGGKNYTQEQLNNMSSAELEKVLPHA